MDGKGADKDKLIEALVIECLGAWLSEGIAFSHGDNAYIIEKYIEATGGYDFWKNKLYEAWEKDPGC